MSNSMIKRVPEGAGAIGFVGRHSKWLMYPVKFVCPEIQIDTLYEIFFRRISRPSIVAVRLKISGLTMYGLEVVMVVISS